jgi:lipoprotein-anchoring transpeptidase ErfK/SrfK
VQERHAHPPAAISSGASLCYNRVGSELAALPQRIELGFSRDNAVLSHTKTPPGARPSDAHQRQPRLPSPDEGWGGHRWLTAALVALIVFIAATILALYVLDRSQWILPGVESLGTNLGGRTSAQAAAMLSQRWREWNIVLDGGDKTWTVHPAELGIELDVEATVRTAHRQGGAWSRLGGLLRGKGTVSIIPVVSANPAVAREVLAGLRSEIDVPPVSASVCLVDGHVEALAPQAGRTLDVVTTVDWLNLHAAQVVAQRCLDLVVLSVPPVGGDVSLLVKRAEEWLAHTFSIRVYDPITDETRWWSADSAMWGRWGTLQVDPLDPTEFNWQLDSDQIEAFLIEQSSALGSERYVDIGAAVANVESAFQAQSWGTSLRVYHRAQQHTVQAGETIASIGRDYGMPYPWIQQANPGVGDALGVGQVLTIPSPDALLPLPLDEHKRIVVSISEQRMWAYQDGAVVWDWPVSTGIASSPTSPGVFQVQSHEENAYAASWDLWMPYFLGIYRPVPTAEFMNGFHGFPTRDGATLLWTGNLGTRVTYGCILLSTANAALLYEWADDGVIVEIRP